MMYEDLYMANLKNILFHGTFEQNNRTGIKTLRLPSTLIVVDLAQEFPILQSRYINWKVAAREMFWIFQKNSNNIKDLNSHIWDKWADEDGSIGKTYGYQVGQATVTKNTTYKNQVAYVLDTLAHDPSSRQAVIDMWNPKDLGEMNLPPCVYSSVWSIINNKLNCMIVQRSADYPVGVPFDTTQYAILTHLFARHLGVEPGYLTHIMGDSHIYENQIEGVRDLLHYYTYADASRKTTPVLKFREGAPTNFWEMSLDDIILEDYNASVKIKFEVAK